MSRLKLYRPVVSELVQSCLQNGEQPAVLPFARFTATVKSHNVLNVASRARSIYKNRQCPYCQHSIVEPVELNDAILNRNGTSISGTATVVGFHCNDCRSEWSV